MTLHRPSPISEQYHDYCGYNARVGDRTTPIKYLYNSIILFAICGCGLIRLRIGRPPDRERDEGGTL